MFKEIYLKTPRIHFEFISMFGMITLTQTHTVCEQSFEGDAVSIMKGNHGCNRLSCSLYDVGSDDKINL